MDIDALALQPISIEYSKQRRREIGQGRRSVFAGSPRALVASVVTVALLDALGRDHEQRHDALEYFAGPLYRHHLGLLSLPVDWLPQGVVLKPTE